MAFIQEPTTSKEASGVPEIVHCDYNLCEGCLYKNSEFYCVLSDEDKLDNFFYKHGVIPCHVKCPKCNAVLEKNSEGRFRCRKRNKKTKKVCNIKITRYKDTFFASVHMTSRQVAEVVLLYLTRSPPRCRFIQNETGLTSATLSDHFSFIREVFIFWAVKNSEQLGGEGAIVEIDEAEIEKREYDRGRYLEGQFLIGAIEQDTKNFFLTAVKDKSAETLIAVIKNKIKPGTTIFSECWRGYDRLGEDNCHHLAMNHSITFINPRTGTDTQNIKRTWIEVKKSVLIKRKSHYVGYLSECLFMMKYFDHRKRLHSFWKSAGQLYPGLPHS